MVYFRLKCRHARVSVPQQLPTAVSASCVFSPSMSWQEVSEGSVRDPLFEFQGLSIAARMLAAVAELETRARARARTESSTNSLSNGIASEGYLVVSALEGGSNKENEKGRSDLEAEASLRDIKAAGEVRGPRFGFGLGLGLGLAVSVRDPQQLSRMLYSNPVCLLGVSSRLGFEGGGEGVGMGVGVSANCMVVSWLTALDNSGCLLLSLNANRHTLRMLLHNHHQLQHKGRKEGEEEGEGGDECGAHFVLSVCVKGMEETLRQVGKCSGRDKSPIETQESSSSSSFPFLKGTKFDRGIPGLTSCRPGRWMEGIDMEGKDEVVDDDLGCGGELPLVAVSESPAHLVCHVLKTLVHDGKKKKKKAVQREKDIFCGGSGAEGAVESGIERGHVLVIARIRKAFVRDRYWDGSM